MLEEAGVTDTVGVVFEMGGVPLPPPQALKARVIEAARTSAKILENLFISVSPVRASRRP
jgi:hypothetical protein